MIRHNLNDWNDDSGWMIQALASQQSSHQLAHELNKRTGSSLSCSKESLILESNRVKFYFRVFFSPETKQTLPFYFVVNQSYKSTGTNDINTLFDEHHARQISLFPSHSKWDYFILCEHENWFGALGNLQKSGQIISSLNIKYQSLKKPEQNVVALISQLKGYQRHQKATLKSLHKILADKQSKLYDR